MTVLKQGLPFEDAGKVMDAGGYVRQSIWHYRAADGQTAPTAMTKVSGVFVVCIAPGKGLHRWEPSMPEVSSNEWESIEF